MGQESTHSVTLLCPWLRVSKAEIQVRLEAVFFFGDARDKSLYELIQVID